MKILVGLWLVTANTYCQNLHLEMLHIAFSVAYCPTFQSKLSATLGGISYFLLPKQENPLYVGPRCSGTAKNFFESDFCLEVSSLEAMIRSDLG